MEFLISVCIPTYNNPAALERCLRSVLQQQWKSLEIIIADDSTNLDTLDLIQSFNQDTRIKYFKNAESLGSPANWNVAVSKASGNFIKIMHHDDWFSDEYALDEFVKVAKSDPANKLFICNGMNVYPNGLVSPFSANKNFLNKMAKDPNILFYMNRIGDPSMTFFRKEDFIPFDENSRWFVDVIFYNCFLKRKGFQCVHIPKSLICVTAGNEHQLTQKISAKEKLEEWLYTFKRYTNIDSERSRILFKVSLIEMLLRYKCVNAASEINNFYKTKRMQLLLKLHVPFQFFSILRRLLIYYAR